MRKGKKQILSALIVVEKIFVILFPSDGRDLERVFLGRVLDGPDHFNIKINQISIVMALQSEQNRFNYLFLSVWLCY
jgi:hypothetical protein